MMFAGLTSRCTMPVACAAPSASAVCPAIEAARSIGAGRRRASRHGHPVDQLHHDVAGRVLRATSYTETMLGGQAGDGGASRSKRAAADGSRSSPRLSVLTATAGRDACLAPPNGGHSTQPRTSRGGTDRPTVRRPPWSIPGPARISAGANPGHRFSRTAGTAGQLGEQLSATARTSATVTADLPLDWTAEYRVLPPWNHPTHTHFAFRQDACTSSRHRSRPNEMICVWG